jgi:hypothetical protein
VVEGIASLIQKPGILPAVAGVAEWLAEQGERIASPKLVRHSFPVRTMAGELNRDVPLGAEEGREEAGGSMAAAPRWVEEHTVAVAQRMVEGRTEPVAAEQEEEDSLPQGASLSAADRPQADPEVSFQSSTFDGLMKLVYLVMCDAGLMQDEGCDNNNNNVEK